MCAMPDNSEIHKSLKKYGTSSGNLLLFILLAFIIWWWLLYFLENLFISVLNTYVAKSAVNSD